MRNVGRWGNQRAVGLWMGDHSKEEGRSGPSTIIPSIPMKTKSVCSVTQS